MRVRKISYKALAHQKAFHLAKTFLVYLSSGYGCIRGDQRILTSSGLVPISQITQPTLVLARSSKGLTWSLATPSFLKGRAELFRVVHSKGSFVATGFHRCALASGKYVHVRDLQVGQRIFHESSFSPAQSSSESFQKESSQDAFRLMNKDKGSPDNCSASSHQCDRQLRNLSNIDQVLIPSKNDVKEFFQLFGSSLDDELSCTLLELTLSRSHLDQSHSPFQINQVLDPLQVLVNFPTSMYSERIWRNDQSRMQSQQKSSCHRLVDEFSPEALHNSLSYDNSSSIIAIESIGEDEFWDLHVFGTNCYFTEDGTLHHNSGKSFCLIMKMLELASQNRGVPGGLLCPDLKMFRRDILPLLKDITRKFEIPMRFHGSDFIIGLPEMETDIFVFHDQDKGASIRGPNLGYGLINEVSMCSKEGYMAFVARIRRKDAAMPQICMSGTPEGTQSWIYDYFVENPPPNLTMIYGRSEDNTHVSPEYFKQLRSMYDEKMVAAYIEGKFINLKGQMAAWAFDRQRHVVKDSLHVPGKPVAVSIDFNVHPMAATLWTVDPEPNVRFRAFDEIKMNGADTHILAEELIRRVGVEAILYPDPAGQARSTRGIAKSDFAILREAGFKDIRAKRSIHSVKDCLLSMNALFDKNQIQIDARCKNLISDLEQVTLLDGRFELDKSNTDRTHWLDGLKNMCEFEYPITRPVASTQRQL